MGSGIGARRLSAVAIAVAMAGGLTLVSADPGLADQGLTGQRLAVPALDDPGHAASALDCPAPRTMTQGEWERLAELGEEAFVQAVVETRVVGDEMLPGRSVRPQLCPLYELGDSGAAVLLGSFVRYDDDRFTGMVPENESVVLADRDSGRRVSFEAFVWVMVFFGGDVRDGTGTVRGPGRSVDWGPVAAGGASIAGSPLEGETLSARLVGEWYAKDIRYQWLRNGTDIAGATAKSYRLQAADRGKRISLRVAAASPGRDPQTRTSASSGIVLGRITDPGVYVSGPRLARCMGVCTAKHRVKMKRASNASSIRYQWYLNKKKVKGQTKRSYTLRYKKPRTGVKSYCVSVRVTLKRAGFKTLTVDRVYGCWQATYRRR